MQSLVRVGAEEGPRGFDIWRAEPYHLMQYRIWRGLRAAEARHAFGDPGIPWPHDDAWLVRATCGASTPV
jgi:hypothetical protein